MSNAIASQLNLLGLEETRRQAELFSPTKSALSRRLNRIEATHAAMGESEHGLVPEGTSEDLAFLHAGLCQSGCGLPHSRPDNDNMIWQRSAGRFHVLVNPGTIVDEKTGRAIRVGVPYGSKARLIMIHLQTEGFTSRVVNLGESMSAFLRSLGLKISGGPRGTMTAVREQCMRIARCSFTLQWSDSNDAGGHTIIQESRIVNGLELWNSNRSEWSGDVELSIEFHQHLKDHAVPLSKAGISLLSGNSFGLDLYALFAHRLHRLSRDLHLSWSQLETQIGSEYADTKALARRTREVIPEVMIAYPEARVDITRHGLIMHPSGPPVPRRTVQGHRFALIESN
jgi:hypothetical protein